MQQLRKLACNLNSLAKEKIDGDRTSMVSTIAKHFDNTSFLHIRQHRFEWHWAAIISFWEETFAIASLLLL